MSFSLMPLPFGPAALEPVMSQETIDYHYGQHHRKYVETLSTMIRDEAGLREASLVEIVRAAHSSKQRSLFNNAAQTWNHNFFWHSLAPSATEPAGELKRLIEGSFGNVSALCEAMRQEAATHFSNGWVWLLLEEEQLVVRSFHDADTPLVHEGPAPLLTLDVWEHAYYIDYRNDRPEYATAVLEGVLNWSFAEENLDGAGASRADQKPS